MRTRRYLYTVTFLNKDYCHVCSLFHSFQRTSTQTQNVCYKKVVTNDLKTSRRWRKKKRESKKETCPLKQRLHGAKTNELYTCLEFHFTLHFTHVKKQVFPFLVFISNEAKLRKEDEKHVSDEFINKNETTTHSELRLAPVNVCMLQCLKQKSQIKTFYYRWILDQEKQCRQASDVKIFL